MVLQVNYISKPNKLTGKKKKKRSDLWFPGGCWEGELDEGSQKVTLPVISKYKGCNIQYG